MTTDKTGDDNATWLEGYSASNYTLDRVVDGEIQCDNFAVSIYGNVQPKVLKSKIKVLARDGILQRFIPVILRKRFNKVGTPIPEQGSKIRLWENTVKRIIRGGVTLQPSCIVVSGFISCHFINPARHFIEVTQGAFWSDRAMSN
jgi:hypothetical protein